MAGRIEIECGRRRRRSALLSLLAAGVTAAIFAWAAISNPWELRWILSIGWAPIALSIAAAIQYRWRIHSGAGAAAAAVYWVLVVLIFFQAGIAFLIGAVLQTCAWYISRPRKVLGA